MVDSIFKKLNFKGQSIISVLKAPEEYQRHIEAMKDVADIQTEISNRSVEFLLIFVLSKEDIKKGAKGVSQIPVNPITILDKA